jgi:opacity protein-like surface antigen
VGKVVIAGICGAAILATSMAARGADLGLRGVPPELAVAAPANWSGLHIGTHTGAATGATEFPDVPGLASIFGDRVRTIGSIGGVQVGYDHQFNSIVLGIEADVSAAGLDGTNTCFAFSGNFSSANCRARIDALGSVTGRLGWAAGGDGRTLLYLRGGAAWAHDKIDITINDSFVFPPVIAGTSVVRWGWTLGAGVEYALSPAWSAKLEYGYYCLGHANVATPYTLNGAAFFDATAQNVHLIKLGMNYKLTGWPAGAGLFGGILDKAPLPEAPYRAADWEIEGGVRYWGSWSRFQKDLGGFVGDVLPASANVSRLTYDGMQANSGELFARVDNSSGIFVKGFIGGGGIAGGHMNDEDWAIDIGNGPVEYSNTISAKVDGSNFYGTADVGYAALRGPGYKVGPFFGYNYFRDKMRAFGCVQIANPLSVCAPPFTFPTSALGITEDDTWQSLRLGSSAEVMLTPRLKLTADAAWLPYVWFSGTDRHIFLGTSIVAEVFPESGHGTGVQLEAVLSYSLTDQLSIGIGGRYWAMRTTSGEWNCFGGLLCPGPTPPQIFRGTVEQAGVLVQAAYKFAAPAPIATEY